MDTGGKIPPKRSSSSEEVTTKDTLKKKVGRFFSRMVKHPSGKREDPGGTTALSHKNPSPSEEQSPSLGERAGKQEERRSPRQSPIKSKARPAPSKPVSLAGSTSTSPTASFTFPLPLDRIDNYESVKKELEHKDLPSFPKLGISEEPAEWSNEDCKTFLKDGVFSNWFVMHANFKQEDELGKKVLTRMVAYREEYVMGALRELKAKNESLQAFSAGSTNLTSDFDVTIALQMNEESLNEDVDIVDTFNRDIRSDLGNPPGVVFDTNLYMQAYTNVKGNLPLRSEAIHYEGVYKVKSEEIKATAQPIGDAHGIWLADQDIMSLMKQRRYMDQRDWNDYVGNLCDNIEDEKIHNDVKSRYNEADDGYREKTRSILNALVDKGVNILAEESDLDTSESSVFRSVGDLFSKGTNPLLRSTIQANLTEEMLNFIRLDKAHKEYPADVLEVYNDFYVSETRRAHALEKELEALWQEPSEDMSAADLRAKAKKSDGIRAKISRSYGEALFYANEAYQSAGAFTHVVLGSQSGNIEEALKQLDPQQLLHSHNEQLGDLLKDIKHYSEEGASSGELAYRSAKYLSRFLETVILLKQKGVLKGELPFEQHHDSIEKLKSRVDMGLLQTRKGVMSFESNEKKEKFSEKELCGLFKINPRYDNVFSSYRYRMLALGAEVNAAVRNSEEYRSTAREEFTDKGSLADRVLKKLEWSAEQEG